jgi:hypothetical protein
MSASSVTAFSMKNTCQNKVSVPCWPRRKGKGKAIEEHKSQYILLSCPLKDLGRQPRHKGITHTGTASRALAPQDSYMWSTVDALSFRPPPVAIAHGFIIKAHVQTYHTHDACAGTRAFDGLGVDDVVPLGIDLAPVLHLPTQKHQDHHAPQGTPQTYRACKTCWCTRTKPKPRHLF